MARVELGPGILDDLDRIFDFVARNDPGHAADRIREIIEALSVLETNPLIGRPAQRNKRELLIGRRSHGYVSLYRYIQEIDTVLVLAVRSQREAGYRHD